MPAKRLLPMLPSPRRGRMLQSVRQALLSTVDGDVIELAAGDGKSLPYYPYDRLSSLTLVDKKLGKQIHSHDFGAIPVTLLSQAPDPLPFDKCSFDHACLFFTLSAIPEPYRTLAELKRILRPGGRVLFLDYTRPYGPSGLMFDSYTLMRRVVSRGAVNPSRNAVNMLEVAGFRINSICQCGGHYIYGEAEKV
ncbi:MAG: class I SAM-dependent methyltransferase [Clostridiales bacterium]|nr:class I SAM-dependent methyltransferase [Clostridiales bacterium]